MKETSYPKTVPSGKTDVPRMFRDLIENIFDLRLICVTIEASTIDDKTEYKDLVRAIDETWADLCGASTVVFVQQEDYPSLIESNLLMKYFDVQRPTDSIMGGTVKTASLSSGLISGKLDEASGSADAIMDFIIASERNMRSSQGPCHGEQKQVQHKRFLKDHGALQFLLTVCLESPLIHLCHLACFVLQSMCKNAHQHSDIAFTTTMKEVTLGQCSKILIRMLEKGAPCLGQSQTHSSHTEALGILRSSVGCCQSGSLVRDVVSSTLKSWSKLYPNPSESAKDGPGLVSTDSMRVNATIAGTLVTIGCSGWPTKITTLVRPLMTSIQNERDEEYSSDSCVYLEELLYKLRGQHPSEQPRSFRASASKVLASLCKLVATGEKPSSIAASCVIGVTVEKMQSKDDFEQMEQLWNSVVPLLDSNKEKDQSSLPRGLRVFNASLQSLGRDHILVPYLFQQFLPSLLETVLL